MGKKFNASWAANKNPENPRGYTVPNFGVDRGIKWTKESLGVAEK